MLKIGFCLPNDTIPRTVFWERFIKALRQSEFFTESNADILVPLEDTAMESNWPRYGNPKSAYVRGDSHDLTKKDGPFQRYFATIIACAESNPRQPFLYVNMNPFFRAPLLLRKLKNVIVADISLAMLERDLNCNTISIPAPPIVFSRSEPSPGVRPILASFQGRIDTHPIRLALKSIAEKKEKQVAFRVPWRHSKSERNQDKGGTIVVKCVTIDHHIGKIDAIELKRTQNMSNCCQIPILLLCHAAIGFFHTD